MNDDKLKKAYQSGLKYYDLPDFETFKSDMMDENNLRRFRDNLSKHYDIPDFNTFKSDMGIGKKKEPSVSPSAQNQKPTSSATPKTEKPKQSGSSSVGGKFTAVSDVVESQKTKDLSKKDGVYTYEGRPGVLYKKSKGKWFIDPKGVGKFTEIPSDKVDRINLLEKQAKQAFNTGFEDNEINLQKTTTFKDKAPTLEQEMKQEVFNEDFFVTPKENMSSMDQIDFVSTEKAKRDMKEGDTEEDFIALKDKYTNSETLRMLDRKGFSVDLSEDINSPKNKKALTEFNASEDLRLKSNAKTDVLDKHVIDIVNSKLMGLTEERAVPLLNKSFGKYGFIFEESGIGDAMTVRYSSDGFNYSDPISIDLQSGDVDSQINNLRSFIKNKYISDYDDYQINAGNIDIKKIRTDDDLRRKYFGNVAELMASNPAKYGEYLFSEGEFDNYIEGEYRLVNARKKELQSDMNKYDELVSKYKLYGDEKMLTDIKNLESDIKEKQKGLIGTISQLESTEEKYKSAVGDYVLQKEKQGSFLGGLSVSFGKGIMGNLTKTGSNVSSDILTELLPYGGMSPLQYQQYKDQGLTDSQINDLSSEKLKRQFKEDIDEAVSNVFSLGTTTTEYVSSSDRTLIEQAVNGLAESVGTALSAGGNKIAQGLAFFNMSYSAMQDELSSKEFDEMSKWEKQGISALYGLVIGKLEKIGFNAASGQTKSELFKRLSSGIIANALKDMPENATINTIDEIIGTSLKNTLKASGVKIVNGFLSEGSTEGIQSLAESGMKDIVNKLHGKNLFSDVPDITTEEGLKIALNKSLYEAAAGGIGGSIMGGFDSFKRVPANRRSDSDFEKIYGILMDENLRRSLKMNEVMKYRKGEASSDQVKQAVRDIDNSVSIMNKIPGELSTRGKRIAFDLLSEKQQLEKQIAGKDPNLVSKESFRINEINEQLKTISQDAVQKQTTSEVSVQPETTTSKEVEGGKPEAGSKKSTQEEITAKEKELDSIWAEKNKLQDDLKNQGLTEEEIRENEDFRAIMDRHDVLLSETLKLKDSLKAEPQVVTEEGQEEAVAIESNDAKVYSQSLEEARNELGKNGPGLDLQVSPVSEQEAQQIVDDGGKLFMTEDGNAGAYVKKDGYMGGLFKNPKSAFKNVSKVLQMARIKAGGKFMDAYGTKLEDMYIKNGFRPVARLKFNEEYAPEGWDAENSPLKNKPDVVFFAYDPDGTYKAGDGEYVEDYDQAYEMARDYNPSVNKSGAITMDETLTKIKEAAVSGNKRVGSMYKAVRSSMRAIPGVKIIVHNDSESYRDGIAKSTGQSKEQVVADETQDRSAGTILANGEIHIDASIADAATVYHEMFHYAAMQKGLSAADIRSIVDAIKSSTKNKELIAKAEAFAKQYEDGEVDEEFFSELGALLTESEELLQPKNIQKFFTIINNMFKKLGLPAPFTSASTRQDAIDFVNSLSKGLREGTEVSLVVRNVDNNIPIENEYVETNGSIVNTDSKRKARIVNTTIKESDIIDPATLEGKPLEIVYYDNYTASEYTLTNRVSGTSIKRKGGGGPGYSYREEIRNAGIIAAFTNVTKGLNLIQGISSRNKVSGDEAVVGVALQNKETGHLGNKDTLFDIYNPNDGEIARAVNDEIISESGAVKMLKDAVVAYEQTKKGQDPKSSLGFSSNDFSTLDEFFKLLDGVSFERRGSFNAVVIPSKADLKITKATKPHVVAWLEAGIPTLSDYYSASTEAYTAEAEAHDIVKYINPNLRKIGVPKGFDVSDKEMSRAKDMGVEIEFIDDSLIHRSYPVVLFGENIGVPSTFHSVRDMSEEWNEPNPFFKAGRRKDTASPVRIPKLKETGRSPKADGRKKRKAPKKDEAIRSAVEKFKISKDRGADDSRAINAAIEDLKKNDWYANASDIEREDAIRDLRKRFGIKEKSAPSVKKVLGKSDSKTVTMNVSTLRDEFIKARSAAARQAAKSIKDVQRDIAAKIKEMVNSGKVSAKQAAILTERLARLNTENPVMVERYLAYAEKVFNSADYAQRLSDAFSIRKKIKRLSKSQNNQAEVRAMGKAFLEIDPSMVDDIDVYNEMAQMIFDALKPSRVTGTEAIYKSAALIEDVNIYTNEMVSMQEEKKKSEMLSIYSELVSAGVLSEDMSFNDIQTIISKINENPEAEIDDELLKLIDPNLSKKTVEEYNKKTFDTLSSIIEDIMKTGVDPITGEEVEWDEKSKDLVKRLMNMDLSRLSVKEQFMAIEALQNFMVNGITSGIEATVYAYDGALNAEKVASEGIKARDLRVYLSKIVGRTMSANFATIPVLFDSMFGGVRAGGRVMEMMGLSKYANGIAAATKKMTSIVDQYGKLFSKSRPNGDAFNSAKNVYERGMLAFLKRTVMGSDVEMNEELSRRIGLLRDSIKELRKGGDSDIKKADIYEELFNKLGLDQEGVSIIDIEARVDKINRDAVDWWIGKWSEHYPDLYDVSLSVFNTQLGKDLNYTPDRFSRTETSEVMSKTEQEEMLAKAGAFSINMDFTDKNKSGVLMEATRPKKTPGRYVDLDFDMSNSNAMKAALIDINTAGVVRQIDSFLKSDAFKGMIPNKKDYTILRARVNSYIRRTKGKEAITNDSLRELNKVTNVLAGLGSTKALGGIFQPVKQTLPVIMNTLINAGRIDIASIIDKDYNEWLDNSGMGIANRGLEAAASIDTANKYLDKAADGKLESVLNAANKANEMWLKVFLSKPDVAIARASFQSYYKQDLKRQGISTDIDWKNHKINQEAANYAQHMVDRQQNVSDAAMGGEFMASNDTTKKLVRKVAMPFANFVMNQKNRMYSDIRTLQSSTSTREDKRTAGRSLIGLTVEMISYQVIAYGIREAIIKPIAAEIAGYIPDDEEEEKQKKYAMQNVVSQGAKDFLSPIPLFDGATLAAFNYVADKVQDVANWASGDSQELKDAITMKNASLDEPMSAKDLEKFKNKWLEEKKWKFEDFQAQSTFGFDLGTLTIVLDKLKALTELADVARTGEFIKEYNGVKTTEYLLEEDRSILKPMVAVEALHILGALPVEASSITRNVEKFVKKKGISEAQKEKYDLVKEKYGKVEPWMLEIVKSKKREDGTMQEIEWVKSFGDLNEKQGSKYIEIFKKREGQVTYDDMIKISKMK